MAASKIDALQLQERDLAVLRGLFESRIMTAGHIAALYFDGKREYTKKRLQKIKAGGLIGERKRHMNEPSVLFLTRKAFDLLRIQGHLSDYPSLSGTSFEARAAVSELTLRHELEIMDVKMAIHTAVSKSDRFSVTKFNTWPVLYQFQTRQQGQAADILVKPDGFITIHEKQPGTKGFAYDCFLEVDRSSEQQEILVSRAGCYLDYYKSGDFAVRNGGTPADFKMFPFRVLLVLKSAERRNNTAERLLQANPPILTMAWLTTLSEIKSDPLGPIWIQPSGYREAVQDTEFEANPRTHGFEYRRQAEREMLVESKIKKLRLLGGDSVIETQGTHQRTAQAPGPGKA